MCRVHDIDLPTEEQRREIRLACSRLKLPSVHRPVTHTPELLRWWEDWKKAKGVK